MADITSIPAARVPVLEPGTNIMSREWYRFLFNQFGQTGGGTTGLALSDLELAPLGEANAAGLVDEVEGLLSLPPNPIAARKAGSFASTATQNVSAINTATAVTFNTTLVSVGVGLSSSSRVTLGVAGAYLVAFDAQFDKTTGGDATGYIWLRKNGADLANTAKRWRVQGNDAELGVSLVTTILLAQTDYIEVMWASPDINVTLDATPSTAFSPAGPSALLSITQVDP